MTDALLGAALVLTIVGIEYVLFRDRFRAMRNSTRRGVLRHIERPGVVYTVPVFNSGGVWNPGHKAVNPYDPPVIYGKGLGTYWRDDADHVHLLYQPESGPARHMAAVVSDNPTRPNKWAVRGVLGGFAGLFLVGFGVAYATSTGSAGDRAVLGLLGAMASWIALSLAALVFRVAQAARDLSGKRVSPAPAPPRISGRIPVEAGPVPDWVLTQLEARRAQAPKPLRYLPRPGRPALAGLVAVLLSGFVLDPISNSDRVSARVGDWIFFASSVIGYGGLALVALALVAFIVRRLRS